MFFFFATFWIKFTLKSSLLVGQVIELHYRANTEQISLCCTSRCLCIIRKVKDKCVVAKISNVSITLIVFGRVKIAGISLHLLASNFYIWFGQCLIDWNYVNFLKWSLNFLFLVPFLTYHRKAKCRMFFKMTWILMKWKWKTRIVNCTSHKMTVKTSKGFLFDASYTETRIQQTS